MATTSGSSRHDGATINTQIASTFGEASSVTVTLLPPRPPHSPHPPKSPHAETLDEEERRRRGADRKERSAECSVSIPAARGPPPAATSAATAGVPRRDEVDPAYCYPQRDTAWVATLAACIALLIVHELVSPLFALKWPFVLSLAFFLLYAVSAHVLSLPISCFALRRLSSSSYTPRAVTVSFAISSVLLFCFWGIGVSYVFFAYEPAPMAYLINSTESAVCLFLLLLTVLPLAALHQHLDIVTSIIGRAVLLALSFDTGVLVTITLQVLVSLVILTPIMQASSDYISCFNDWSFSNKCYTDGRLVTPTRYASILTVPLVFIAIWILLAVVTSALFTISGRFGLVCTATDLSTGSGNSSTDGAGPADDAFGANGGGAATRAATGAATGAGAGAGSTEADEAGKQHGWWQRIVKVAKHDSAFMCASIGTVSAISCAAAATLLLAVCASKTAYSSLGAGIAAALASGLLAWIAALALCFLYCLVLPISATGRLSFLPSLHIALRTLSRAFSPFLLLLAVSLALLLPVAVLAILAVGCGGLALTFVAVWVLAPLLHYIMGLWNVLALFVEAAIMCFITGVSSAIVLTLVLVIGVSTVFCWDFSSQVQTLTSGQSEFQACLIP